MMQSCFSKNEGETEEIGKKVAGEVLPNEFVALYGPMGAGKTAFARGFAGTLVPSAAVSSPTYALLNTYSDEKHTVHHFDMYRIASEDDLISTGFYELVGNGICLCEWPENIPFALPDSFFKITFEVISENERTIHVERVGP